MITLIQNIKEAARKRAAYVRTRDEIARMPMDLAWDLDIHPADAAQIARKVVYGS
ncbi:hypothetical protein Q9295_04090 [Xinfangfangia sp. CPCC 101601]|uniref:DUF1127 domain-containing protein n=1 Tax=Pseudogemmobacter lacusdianii TaxID=3069608 RepID=A0ABU0VUY5_9RHOB|nr:hypothetical protein [Xinfangfangia sp. CPCC 101601]MDQ2065541.1 hypothetical protein [Xinfangfangia sp. CPCC 101601]